jgi:hypothetical protein
MKPTEAARPGVTAEEEDKSAILCDQIAFSKNFGAGNPTADVHFPLAVQTLRISGN